MKEKFAKCLKTVFNPNISISLILASEKKKQYEFRKVKIGKQLGDEFHRIAKEYFSKINSDIEEDLLEFKEYTPGYKSDSHEFEYINIDNENHTSLKELLDSFPDFSTINIVDFEELDFIKNLSFYLIILSVKGNHVILYRKYNAKKELTQSKLIAAFYKNGVYDKFEEKLFLFDEKIDCFLVDNIMFIENVYYFQLIFKYFEGIKDNAIAILNEIECNIPISGVEEFKNVCNGQIQMLAKLNNIAKKDYFKRITIEDIKKTIQAFKLDIKIIKENQQEKVVFDKKNKWAILKLLDDDYLGSIMTETQYIVNSKKAI